MSAFIVSTGIFMLGMAIIASWLFRKSSAPFFVKLIIPVALVAFACITPFRVSALLGYPVDVSFNALPRKAELIAFVPYDDEKKVELWLRVGSASPRAYSVKLTDDLKKTLRDAQQQKESGGHAVLVKKGKKLLQGYTDQDGGDAPYVLDSSIFSLPNKDGKP